MDITLLSPNSIKLKGKVASFLVEPRDTKGKLAADAVITFDNTPIDTSAIEGVRVVIAGAGDYEVGGVKMVGVPGQGATLYYINIDSIIIMVGKSSALKNKESLRDANIAILFSDGPTDTSLLASLGSSVAIFYGTSAMENIKSLGKEASAVMKYTITKDKLPTEMEAILLA